MPRYAKITKSKRQLEDLLNYQKSKTKWYMDECRRLQGDIDKHDKQLAKRDALVGQAEQEVEVVKDSKRRLVHNNKVIKYRSKQNTKRTQAIRQDVAEFKQTVVAEVAYLTKDRDWDKDVSRELVVEVILRTIIAYNRLISGGVINFNELAYLLIGYQKDAFRLTDVAERFGKLGGRNRQDFATLVEAGMIRKVYRKQAYWLTETGRDRLNDILKYIYESKAGTYKVFEKLFKLGVKV